MFPVDVLKQYKERKLKIYRNYCKKYKFYDKIAERSFNDKYNDVKFWKYMNFSRFNITKMFFETIKTRILDNANIVIVIFGITGGGKSEAGQYIATYIQKAFLELYGKEVKIRIAMSTAEFDKILPEMEEGDIGIRDESPKLSGTGSRTVQFNLDNLIKIVRAKQISFILVSPEIVRAPVVTAYLECAGKDKKGRINRFMVYDKDLKLMGRCYIPLHDNQELRERYEKKKYENIDGVLNNSGSVGIEINNKPLERDIKRYKRWCIENGIDKRRDIELQLPRFNSLLEDGDKISNITYYRKVLFSSVYTEIKNDKIEVVKESEINNDVNENKEIVKEDNLTIYKGFRFRNYQKELELYLNSLVNFRDKKRDFEIYRKYKNGTTQLKLRGIYKIDNSTVCKIVKKVEGAVSKYKGEFFEVNYQKYLQGLDKFKDVEVILDGDPGKPDIYVHDEMENILYVFSVKNLELNRNPYTILVEDLRPELKFAYDKKQFGDYEDVFMYLVVFDSLTEKLYVEEIEYLNPTYVNIYN